MKGKLMRVLSGEEDGDRSEVRSSEICVPASGV